MSDSLRLSFRLLAVGAFCLSMAAVFLIGVELGKGGEAPSSNNAAVAADSLRVHLLKERDTLKSLLAESERQRVILERAMQVHQEASKALREQLKEVEDARLEANRELTYLKRLVQGGGKGAVQVYDMRLIPGESPHDYRYSFTITQLIQGFGQSQGDVRLSVEGLRDDKSVVLGLDELPAARPNALRMDFEHFQNCQGTFTLPETFEPTSIIVEIKPKTPLLLPTSVTFPWAAASQ